MAKKVYKVRYQSPVVEIVEGFVIAESAEQAERWVQDNEGLINVTEVDGWIGDVGNITVEETVRNVANCTEEAE